MTTYRVRHLTTYSYDRPVEFGLHRLLVRPRDGHDMRLLDTHLAMSPEADVRWAYDTFGNSVALLSFHEPSAELSITSELTVRRYAHDDPIERLSRHSGPYPFAYDADEALDLGPLLRLQHEGDRPGLTAWLDAKLPRLPDDTMLLLDGLVCAVHEGFDYARREEHGVQTPAETISLGSGTCRDFALFFMEAARHLGFAARFVSGYLYDAAAVTGEGADSDDVRGGGATHAWADVFVPGSGWIEFDPTNRIIAGRNLLRVATTRTPAQALPLSGTFRGRGAQFLGMDVQVDVSRLS